MIDNGSLRGNFVFTTTHFVFTTPHFVFTPQLCVPQSCSHRNRLRNATDFATQPSSKYSRVQNAVVFTTQSYSLRMYVFCVLLDLCSQSQR